MRSQLYNNRRSPNTTPNKIKTTPIAAAPKQKAWPQLLGSMGNGSLRTGRLKVGVGVAPESAAVGAMMRSVAVALRVTTGDGVGVFAPTGVVVGPSVAVGRLLTTAT